MVKKSIVCEVKSEKERNWLVQNRNRGGGMQARRKSEEDERRNMTAKKNRNREEQRNGGEEWGINEEGSVEWRSGKERVG